MRCELDAFITMICNYEKLSISSPGATTRSSMFTIKCSGDHEIGIPLYNIIKPRVKLIFTDNL